MVIRRWEINNLGLDKKKEVQVSSVSDDQFLEFTMGYGAGENVMHEKGRQGLLLDILTNEMLGSSTPPPTARPCRTLARTYARWSPKKDTPV